MYFKLLKYENNIYSGYVTTIIDKQGNQVVNPAIPEEYFTDITLLKSLLIDTIKWQAGLELKKTDWIVVKCIEEGKDPKVYYSDIITKREAIRQWSNDIENLVNQETTIDRLSNIDIILPNELKFND